ncbi:MAG: hypothetical protein ACTHOU_21860 [Aureliella sp.]
MNYDKPILMNLSEIEILAVTRAMLGLGAGLLVAEHLRPKQRVAVGRTLLAIGVVSTIPLAASVFSKLGVFGKQSEDTSDIRQLGRRRQTSEQGSGLW